MSEERGLRKTREGIVVSDKMDKTIVVQIERMLSHSRYHKYIRARRRLKVHDERNEVRTGDRVSIVESRPLSREKRWRLQSIIERAKR